jgi:spore maturation protein CgeB
MRVVMFYHSLLSDWDHGAAHFLRGVVSDLLDRGHDVRVYEPFDAWSLKSMIAEHGAGHIREFRKAYPALRSVRYRLDHLDLDEILDRADLVIAHKWNDRELIRRVGEHRARVRNYRLLFHDTHHRSGPEVKCAADYDLSNYDGALAFGEVTRDQYLSRGEAERAWVWREAADIRMFYPRMMSVGGESGNSDEEENRAGRSPGENSPHQSTAPATAPPARFPALPTLPVPNFQGDLVWIGNWGDDRRAESLREFFVDPVSRLKLKARVYGVGYPGHARRTLARAGIECCGWLPNYLAPQVYANFKCVVHAPRAQDDPALSGVPSMRLFEALACGIPLVSAPWDDAENLFTPGEDYLVARDGDEMDRRLGALLADDDMRDELSENGLRTILNRHTCTHRVNELLHICAELNVNTEARASESGRMLRAAAGGRR